MKIKATKLNPDIILPTRAHYNDAGLDCYSPDNYILPPLGEEPVMIPLGFSLDVPDGYMAVIKPRSSFNKKGIWTGIGTCDSGYHGEYKAVFMNLTSKETAISKGDRICQIVIEPVILADLVEDLGDERKEGGFGSSGK